MKSKKILSMFILIITIIGLSTISNAALESKARQTSWKSSANDEFTNIRKMEKIGGTLGQNANINGTTYLDSSNNGIDVHMALATEWGTAAILAVSDYGVFNTKGTVEDKDTKIAATTGNITGVFQMADANKEHVSGVFKNGSSSLVSAIYAADTRYRNEYTSTTSEYHKGDAMYQTAGWYTGGASYANSSHPIYYRYNGLFGFSHEYGYGNGEYGLNIYARAVVVCGEGL